MFYGDKAGVQPFPAWKGSLLNPQGTLYPAYYVSSTLGRGTRRVSTHGPGLTLGPNGESAGLPMLQRPFPEIEQDLRERFSRGGQERPSVASSFRVTRTLAPGAAPRGSDFFPAIAAVRSPLCQCLSALLLDFLGRPCLCSPSQAICTQFQFLF